MKRRLLIIAICLLLGAVVNVAVAWGCVVFVDVSSTPGEVVRQDSSVHPMRLEQLCTQRAFGRSRINRLETYWGEWGGGDELDRASREEAGWPRESGGLDELDHASREEAGWPLYSLACSTSAQVLIYRDPGNWGMRASSAQMMRGPESGRGASIRGGIEIWPEYITVTGQQVGIWRALPYRPLWPGFAVNTLFYAVILWLLMYGPFALRRFLRVRRGLCPKCAYPMGESAVCSECGVELPSRPAAP